MKLCRLQSQRDVVYKYCLGPTCPSTPLRQKLFCPFNKHHITWKFEPVVEFCSWQGVIPEVDKHWGSSGWKWCLVVTAKLQCVFGTCQIVHQREKFKLSSEWFSLTISLPYSCFQVHLTSNLFILTQHSERRDFGDLGSLYIGSLFSRPNYISVTQKRCWTSACEMEMESNAAQGGLAFKTGQNSSSEECTDCRDRTYGFYLNLSGTVVL